MGSNEERLLPTPLEIVGFLDRYVIGQDQAKRDVATAVYAHYLGLAGAGEDRNLPYGPQHVLLLGPTGTGKTYLVRRLAELLDVPVAFASATNLVESGYVGDQVDTVVHRLLVAADGDAKRASRGIIFIDEIDKVRRSGGTTRDVSGTGVQNGLLTLIEGRIVGTPRGGIGDGLHTGSLLFICAGAFVDLAPIIRERLGTDDRVGFASNGPHPTGTDTDVGDLFRAVHREDLEGYGMIPELIGRFATISTLDALGREDLIQILHESEGSALQQQKSYFRDHGIELDVTEDALVTLAEEALRRETGARGLSSILLRAIDHVDYRPLELYEEGVRKVRLTKEVLTEGAAPDLIRASDATRGKVEADVLRKRALPGGSTAAGASSQGAPRRRAESRQEAEARRAREVQARSSDLEQLEKSSGVDEAPPEAKAWYEAFRKQQGDDPEEVVDLLRTLIRRRIPFDDFVTAAKQGQTNDAMAALYYYEYLKARKSTEPDDGQA